MSSKISPALWFDGRALEAARYYVEVFGNARIVSASTISAGPAEGGSIVEFELDGQRFEAFDGGPMYRITPAVSFSITCDTQEEVDHYWERLGDGGTHRQCGWLEDRFGVSWQVVPAMLGEVMSIAPDRVMEALLAMEKIEIEGLRQAAASD